MVAVAVAVLVGGLLVADRVTANNGDQVLIVGDSITDWYRTPLQRAIGGTYGLDIIARAGATADQMLPAARAAADTDPDQVIINLGTNDINTLSSPVTTFRELNDIADLYPGAECIHVVTVNSHTLAGKGRSGPLADDLNRRIEEWAATDDQVDVVDWDGIVSRDLAAHPPSGTPLTKDLVHPNDAGTRRLTGAYRKAIDGCGRPSFLW